MTSASRCSTCDTNWPVTHQYATCPTCKVPTWKADRETPLTVAAATTLLQDRAKTEAESDRRHDEFEQYYADCEAAHLLAELDIGLPA